jgi:hypothetical protein
MPFWHHPRHVSISRHLVPWNANRHTGTIFQDLKHHRCNRVYVPWTTGSEDDDSVLLPPSIGASARPLSIGQLPGINLDAIARHSHRVEGVSSRFSTFFFTSIMKYSLSRPKKDHTSSDNISALHEPIVHYCDGWCRDRDFPAAPGQPNVVGSRDSAVPFSRLPLAYSLRGIL